MVVTRYTRPVHAASVAVPSPNCPAAVPFPALSTLDTQDSPTLTSVQVSPTPESPAQTFLLLSRLRPRVPQHLLGNHLISNLGHQIDLPMPPRPAPPIHRPPVSAALSFRALRPKAGAVLSLLPQIQAIRTAYCGTRVRRVWLCLTLSAAVRL